MQYNAAVPQQPLTPRPGRILLRQSSERRHAIPARLRRVSMEARRAGADGHALARCAAALGRQPAPAWQRTSVFRVRDRPLPVNGLFLEDFARD